MENQRNILIIITGFLIGIGLLAWLGFRVQPKSFPVFKTQSQPLKKLPLPDGLPAPVEQFCKTVYGEGIPVIKTEVILGRGILKLFMKIPVPARHVFFHIAGKDYRH